MNNLFIDIHLQLHYFEQLQDKCNIYLGLLLVLQKLLN